jgi:hypothetical protein
VVPALPDTQGQTLPAFGLAEMLGLDLLPRIRNWQGLIFYRPSPVIRYEHIDALFGDDPRNAINWKLIEAHWVDLVRTVISIREGRVSSVVLLCRLRNDSRKNRLYRAFRELGRVTRTIVPLRYLSEPELREGITAITNRAEAFHGFAKWSERGGEGWGGTGRDGTSTIRHREVSVGGAGRLEAIARVGPVVSPVVGVSTASERGLCCPPSMVNRELNLHFALRSDDSVEVGILGDDIVARRGGCLARMLRESCPPWVQEVLLVAELRLPMALATAHYTGGVLRIYRLGQP